MSTDRIALLRKKREEAEEELRKQREEIEARHRKKRAALDAQLKRLEATRAKQERKDDARRKIMVGALALEHMIKNKDSAFTKVLFPLLDEYVTRPQDRELFNAHFREAGFRELPARAANDGAA